MENALVLCVSHAIVRVMAGHESVPVPHESEKTRSEKIKEEYARALIRYFELKGAVNEQQEIVQGQKPRTPEERMYADLSTLGDALIGQQEVYGQQNNMYAERATVMLEQLNTAKMTILGLYFDARQESDELARHILSEHPWIEAMLAAANDDTYEVEKAA